MQNIPTSHPVAHHDPTADPQCLPHEHRHHEASWRLPESDPTVDRSVEYFQRLARTAERGRLDSVFFADSPSLFGDPDSVARRPPQRFEPTRLLAAMAAVTERIGLIATATTTYDEPHNTARQFARRGLSRTDYAAARCAVTTDCRSRPAGTGGRPRGPAPDRERLTERLGSALDGGAG